MSLSNRVGHTAALLCVMFCLAEGRLKLGARAPGEVKREKLDLLLENHEDMSMRARVHFGNQVMRVIMDTGSPEQVIFSDKCTSCGGDMYNCDRDPACSWGTHECTQNYGSGQTSSTEAQTTVFLSNVNTTDGAVLTVDALTIWLVVKAELLFHMDGSLQGIFGLGPASSAGVFAQLEYDHLEELVSGMSPRVARNYVGVLADMKKHLSFVRHMTVWQEAAQVETFSFCMHPELGRNGKVIFHDNAPEIAPHSFVSVPTTLVDGHDLYWSVPMGKSTISLPNNTIEACAGGPCVAIMDTGTSLIGAPKDFVHNLSLAMSKVIPEYGCENSDMKKYPDFILKFGDHQFTLPPQTYVCKFTVRDHWWDRFDHGEDAGRHMHSAASSPLTHMRSRLGYLKPFRDAHKVRTHSNQSLAREFCAPCFFSLDQGDDRWLFGLPFFRQYYTTFRTSPGYRRTQEILFAKTSNDCKPTGKPSGSPRTMHSHTSKQGVMHISPSKLRLPPIIPELEGK